MNLRDIKPGQKVNIEQHIQGTILLVEGWVDKVSNWGNAWQIDFPGYYTEYSDDDDLRIILLEDTNA